MRFNIAAITTGVLAFSAPLATAFLTNASDIVNGITFEIGGVQNMESQMSLINATNVGYAWNVSYMFPHSRNPKQLLI